MISRTTAAAIISSISVLIIVTVVVVAVQLTKKSSLSNASSSSSNTSLFETTAKLIKLSACIDDKDLNSTNSCSIASNSFVYLNNSFIGTTDINGSITLKIDPFSNYTLHVIDRANGYGYQTTQLLTNSTVYLLSEFEEPILTNINGYDDSIIYFSLNYNWSNFSVYFHYKGNSSKEKIRQIRAIELYNSLVPDTIYDLTDSFAVNSDNSFTINQTSYLISIITAVSFQKHGTLRFKFLVDLDLNEDSIYLQQTKIDVFLTQFYLTGKVGLNSSNIFYDSDKVSLTLTSVTNSILSFALKLDSLASNFSSIKLPIGTYFFDAKTTIYGIEYKANGNVLLSSNLYLDIKLLTFNQQLQGFSSFSTASLSKRSVSERVELTNSNAIDSSGNKRLLVSSKLATVTATSNQRNQIISDIQELTIDSKVKIIRLSYYIKSAEYPYYVKQQSIFNDLWSVSVYTSDGDILYSKNKDVNSMLFTEPLWLSIGTTQLITTDIDTSNLINKNVSVFLKATSVNIGDSLFNTTVNGSLSIESSDLVIKSVQFDSFIKCLSSTYPDPCFKSKNVLSIPESNQTNVNQKYVSVVYDASSQVVVNKIEVYFVPEIIPEIITLSTTIDNDYVKQIDESTLQIRVSFSQPNNITFKLFDRFNIKIVLYYTLNDNSTIKTAQKLSPLITALWRAPNYNITNKRFSTRETGGDDWASKSMYNWLNTNSSQSLWSRYDDISGEHSLNLGQNSHELGNHIDIFHYYTLDSSSGENNFNSFLNDITANNVTSVAAWIKEHRIKFDALNANKDVVQFITHKGKVIKSKNLKNNWVRNLMENGKLNNLIDLSLEKWKSPAKLRWVSDHKDYITIQIK